MKSFERTVKWMDGKTHTVYEVAMMVGRGEHVVEQTPIRGTGQYLSTVFVPNIRGDESTSGFETALITEEPYDLDFQSKHTSLRDALSYHARRAKELQSNELD